MELLAGLREADALQFWEDSLKEPARMWMSSSRSVTHPSWANRQQSLYVPGGTAPSVGGISLRQPGQPSAPGEGRRGLRKRGFSEHLQPQPDLKKTRRGEGADVQRPKWEIHETHRWT